MEASSGRPTGARPFGILDGMTLVAALAVGIATVRWVFPEVTTVSLSQVIETVRKAMSERKWIEALSLIAEIKMFLLNLPMALLSLALLILRFRSPRPRRRRMFSQPGVMACVSVSATAIITALLALLSLMIPALRGTGGDPLNGFLVLGSSACGFAVAVSWMTLVLVGRWRPERGWIDRMGRVLGLYWMSLAPVEAMFLASAF